jgi:hypothetical protein
MTMPPSLFEPTKVVGGSTTESKKITMQPVPKQESRLNLSPTRSWHQNDPHAEQRTTRMRLTGYIWFSHGSMV